MHMQDWVLISAVRHEAQRNLADSPHADCDELHRSGHNDQNAGLHTRPAMQASLPQDPDQPPGLVVKAAGSRVTLVGKP